MNFTIPNQLPYPLSSSDDSHAEELVTTRASALTQLGVTLVFEDSFTEALERFSEALTLDPQSTAIREWRAACHMLLEMPDKAILDLEQIVLSNPKYATGYNNRAVCHIRLGCLTKALEDLDTSIALNPEYVMAHINRARVHCRLGQYAQAQEDCNVGSQLNPNSEDLLIVQREILKGLYSMNTYADVCEGPSP